MHLLVLDDDRPMATFMGAVAQEYGWTVDITTREADFQSCCLSHPPDAILLDLQLHDGDGVEQLHFLHRENYRGAVVLVSGFEPRVRTAARQVGDSLGLSIVTELPKPMRVRQLGEVLTEIKCRLAPLQDGLPAPKATTRLPPKDRDIRPDMVAAAIAADEMELHLQPMVSAATRAVVRFEALIRWRHPDHGLVFPDDFIPVAERENAVIDRLTMWVIGAALNHYRHLAALGFPTPISVNVSGLNLHSLDFPDRVAALVEGAQVPPAGIIFEITESIAMRDPGLIIDILTRLRLKGFGLAMDDFGTGFSSLKALRSMPFTEIKVDKSFVTDLLTSADSLVIVKSVLDLARNMGMESVAEGVETEETAQRLAALGADTLQGYRFSRPLSVEATCGWLMARSSSRDGSPQ